MKWILLTCIGGILVASGSLMLHFEHKRQMQEMEYEFEKVDHEITQLKKRMRVYEIRQQQKADKIYFASSDNVIEADGRVKFGGF